MNIEHRLVSVLAAVILIGSCTTGDEQVAGIDRGGIVVGPISGFGSIVVNGVRYDTGSTAVTVNGEPGLVDDLEVGYVITAQVSYSVGGATPVANTVSFESILAGPISDISIGDDRFVALGQIVYSNSDTSYATEIDPPAIDSLAIGQMIKVSGFSRSDGSIQATRIDPAAAEQPFEVVGAIKNIDDTLKIFNIGNLVVDYNSLTLIEPLDEGDRVRVTGTQLGAAGELIADEILPRQFVIDSEAGDEAEVEGLITAFVSPTQFTVAGIPVSTDSETEFEDGNASDLSNDVRVEVEGKFDLNGDLLAKKIEFRQSGELKLAAPIESIDGALNELVMLGVSVEMNDLTSFEDKSPLELKHFGLSDLNPGEYVKIKGYESLATPGVLVAVSLERTENKTTVKARGIAANVVNPTLSIFGVAIATDTNTEYTSADEATIDAAEFFATAEGQLVEAKGPLVGEMILAEEIEFED